MLIGPRYVKSPSMKMLERLELEDVVARTFEGFVGWYGINFGEHGNE